MGSSCSFTKGPRSEWRLRGGDLINVVQLFGRGREGGREGGRERKNERKKEIRKKEKEKEKVERILHSIKIRRYQKGKLKEITEFER